MNQTYDPILEIIERPRVLLGVRSLALGTAVVLEPAVGEPLVVQPGEPVPRFGRYRRMLLIDTASHVMDLTISVATADPAFSFSITVSFRSQVIDPAAIARDRVRDMAAVLTPFLTAIVRSTAGRFDVAQSSDAEAAITAQLTSAVPLNAVRLTAFAVTIGLADEATAKVVQHERRASERERELRAKELAKWEPGGRGRDEMLARHMAQSEVEDLIRLLGREQKDMESQIRASLELIEKLTDSGLNIEEEFNVSAIRKSLVEELFSDKNPLTTARRESLRSRIADLSAPARFLVAAFPDRAPARSEVSLVVRIGSDPSGWTASTSRLDRLVVPPGGTQVTVLVQATRDLIATGALEQQLWVPERGDSEPVRFGFRAHAAGLHRVRATAFAGGTFLAELEVEVSVEADGPTLEGEPATALLGAIASRVGEVTLQVRADGGHTVFQLLSDRYLFGPVVAQAMAADAGPAVERTITVLRQLAAGDTPYTGGTARRWMKETGVGLWHGVVPDQIKDQFWQLHDHITAFSIATSQDTIPWELLYPMRPNRSDDGFLVEQFPVHRRVFDQPRSDKVSIAPCTYVVSEPAPDNAHDEITAIIKTVGAGQIVDNLHALLDVIDSGRCGALHFACHNRFSADEGSAIAMAGGDFVPGLLNTARLQQVLAATRPLVFLNACRTDGSVPEFCRTIGWAQQFMGAGAGAFIGTLWPTRSSSARAFAESFYTHLQNGSPLGAAALHARRAIAATDPDPTWLAYTIYGDPHASATDLNQPTEGSPQL